MSQLIECLIDWTENYDNGKETDIIYLDFSKAFDSIRHDTLFKKYSKLDVADELYNWLISYFKERSHYTEYAGFES